MNQVAVTSGIATMTIIILTCIALFTWHKFLRPVPLTDVLPVGASAQFFDQCGYQGTKIELGEGTFSAAQGHFPDDIIKSAKIPLGYEATLYNIDESSGRSVVLTAGNYECFAPAITNSVSKIILRPVTPIPVQLPVAKFYFDCNYAGVLWELGVGQYHAWSGAFVDKAISSIKVPAGLKVTLKDLNDNLTMILESDLACLDQTYSLHKNISKIIIEQI